MSRRHRRDDIFSSPDRGANQTYGVSGVLAGLFRQMLTDLNINGFKWARYMDEYVHQESIHQKKDNRRDRTSIRGNYNKEFLRPNMTWKVFCRAMKFLKIKRISLIIVADHEDGRRTGHGRIADFRAGMQQLPEIDYNIMMEAAKACDFTGIDQRESLLQLQKTAQLPTATAKDSVQRISNKPYGGLLNELLEQQRIFEERQRQGLTGEGNNK